MNKQLLVGDEMTYQRTGDYIGQKKHQPHLPKCMSSSVQYGYSSINERGEVQH